MKEGIEKIIISKSKTFLAFCFCFIVGSAGMSVFDFSRSILWFWYYAVCLGVSFIIIFWKNKTYRFILLSLVFISLGALRYEVTVPNCKDQNNLCFYNDEELSFQGFVAEEPGKKIDSTEYLIKVSEIKAENSNLAVSGKVLVKAPLYPKYEYGQVLNIQCRLLSPQSLDTGSFRYDRYLLRRGASSVCFRPVITNERKTSGSSALALILKIKNNLEKKIETLWPEPAASLVSGILYGGRSSMPESLAKNFSVTGVSHIVAVSGYNITIIIVIVMGALVSLGLYRQQAFYLVFASTVVYVVMSGLSASAVRAAVMGIIVLVSRQVGRGSSIFNVLVLAAALMQAGNPYLVVWDVGFQLSFLATIGLVYLSPLLKKQLSFLPAFLLEQFSSTISAIIMTLPLILFQFGTFSIVAPLVNLLVLWIIPYLMLLGFAATVLSFILLPVAKLVAGVAYAGISYLIAVVELFGSRSWSYAEVPLGFWPMLAVYAILIFGLIKFRKKSI